MQCHDEVTLAGVLQRTLIGGFDFDLVVLTMYARWTLRGSGVDFDALIPINSFDLKVRYAYDVSCVGHRCYLY